MELPPGWTWTTLGEIAAYINGRAFKPSEWSKEGLPIVRIQNLNRGSSDYNYCNFPVDDKFYVAHGDLLFGWSGTPDTSFGAHIWNGGRAVLNQHIFRIVVEDRLIHKKYFLHALNHKVKEFVSKAHGTAGLAHITKRKFEESQIALPPLPEQNRIVEKIEALFSELDKGIEQLKTAQQQLKVYRQAVLKWAFEGKLTAEWRKSQIPNSKFQIARDLLERIKQEREAQAKVTGKKLKPIAPLTEKELAELLELPEGWGWVRLGNLIREPKYGTSKKCDYGIRGMGVLRIPNIGEGIVDDSDLKFAKFDKKEREIYRLEEGDLLTIRSNGSVDLVGKCALVSKHDEEYLFAGYLIRLRPLGTVVNSKYLLNGLNSHDLRNQIVSKAKSTSGVNNINSDELRSLIIPFCSLVEQGQIVQEIETRLSVCDKLEETITASLQQSEALRQSILKKAFEGKLVPQDPRDEPASVLLDRIRRRRVANREVKPEIKQVT